MDIDQPAAKPKCVPNPEQCIERCPLVNNALENANNAANRYAADFWLSLASSALEGCVAREPVVYHIRKFPYLHETAMITCDSTKQGVRNNFKTKKY